MNQFKKIEAFLDGHLSPEQHQQMLHELKTDRLLAQEVNRHKQLRLILNGYLADVQEEKVSQTYLANKQLIDYVYSKHKENSFTYFFSYRKLVISLAIIFIIVLLSIFTFSPFNTSNCDIELLANRYEDPKISSELHVYSSEKMAPTLAPLSKNYAMAKIAYAEKDFEKVLRILHSLEDHSQPDYLMLKGLCQYQLNQFNQAINTFNNFEYEDKGYYQKAMWYSFLAYLRLGNWEKAKETLKYIIDSEEHYQQKTAMTIINHFSCFSDIE